MNHLRPERIQNSALVNQQQAARMRWWQHTTRLGTYSSRAGGTRRRWEQVHQDADREMLSGQGRGFASRRRGIATLTSAEIYADAAIPCCAATPRIPAALRAAAAGRNTIAPKRPEPALTACTAPTLILPAASLASRPAAAPGRSSPCTKNAVCLLPSLSLACFAAATSAAVFSGTKMSSAFVAVR